MNAPVVETPASVDDECAFRDYSVGVIRVRRPVACEVTGVEILIQMFAIGAAGFASMEIFIAVMEMLW